MKKINFFVALLAVITVTFNLLGLRVLSQSSSGLDTYTITLINKDGKTSLNSPTSGLNIKVAPGGLDVAGIDSGASFKATGATPVLTSANPTTNVISTIWSGGISDGKVIITGKLKQGVSIAPNFTVVSVEKDGGKDITGDLNITVNLSSSTASEPSSSSSSGSVSSSSSSGSVTTSSSSGSVNTKEPSITLSAPEQFVVKKTGGNVFKLKATGANFTSTVKCEFDISDDSIVRVKPVRFLLSPARNTKLFLAKIPTAEVRNLLSNSSSDIVTVDVTCTNDASDSIDIIIASPDTQ